MFKEKIEEIVRESELAPFVMPAPGVGPSLAAAFIAYAGDGCRFAKGGEAANYTGLTPKTDCSGETNRYGHIQRRRWVPGAEKRRAAVRLALARSSGGGSLKAKFAALSPRTGKTKSAAAIARRMIVLMRVLAKRRELYNGVSASGLERKFRCYKLAGWESLLKSPLT
ncbi:MAG: hypothetical protein Pg6C_11880 [Treponemataceae bacterium]|nr:MAG: hypothetical protein Pg6C_11880 [Treponemataceae bacterium]